MFSVLVATRTVITPVKDKQISRPSKAEVNGSLYRSGQWKPAYESIRQPESLTGKAPINDNLKAGVDAKGSKQN